MLVCHLPYVLLTLIKYKLVFSYFDCISVHFYFPDVLQYRVHWSPIVKLLLEFHPLSCHLYTHKHVEKSRRQVCNQGVLVE